MRFVDGVRRFRFLLVRRFHYVEQLNVDLDRLSRTFGPFDALLRVPIRRFDRFSPENFFLSNIFRQIRRFLLRFRFENFVFPKNDKES